MDDDFALAVLVAGNAESPFTLLEACASVGMSCNKSTHEMLLLMAKARGIPVLWADEEEE